MLARAKWSRSRSELCHKGATSGNTQRVAAVHQDCDSDALVVQVEPAGPACHTGKRSCFYRDLEGEEVDEAVKVNNLGAVLNELYDLIESRRRDRPEGSYTTYLFEQGLDKILKKLGEEACETIIAAKNDEKEPLISESADLLYHLIVLLVGRGVSLDEVKVELISRRTKGASSDRLAREAPQSGNRCSILQCAWRAKPAKLLINTSKVHSSQNAKRTNHWSLTPIAKLKSISGLPLSKPFQTTAFWERKQWNESARPDDAG